MKTIIFIKSTTPYVANDIAGFDDVRAEKYIKLGYAKEYVAPVQTPSGTVSFEPIKAIARDLTSFTKVNKGRK